MRKFYCIMLFGNIISTKLGCLICTFPSQLSTFCMLHVIHHFHMGKGIHDPNDPIQKSKKLWFYILMNFECSLNPKLDLFLCVCSYANNPSLATIELMNEPHAPGVTLDNLKNYYKSEYDVLRKYTPSVYVILKPIGEC